MTILWWIFEILINIYQGFIMTFFVYSYLGSKNKQSFAKSNGLLFAMIFAIAITVLNIVTGIFEHFFALIYIVILFTYALFFLKGSLFRKLFASAYAIVVLLISSAFVSLVATVLFKTNLALMFTLNSIERFIAMVVVQLLILYIIILSLRLLKRSSQHRDELSSIEWSLIFIVLIISILMGTLLIYLSTSQSMENAGRYSVLLFLGIIVVNVVVCYLVIDLGKKNRAIRENEVLKLSQEYNRQYIDNATAEYDTIKKIQHDFKNSFSTIYSLIKNGNVTEATKQIESNLDMLQSFEIFVKSNNTIVNTVVNAKLTEAKSFGIDCSCMCGTDLNTVDDLDLCRLLSNMLENAVTSCVNSKRDRKQITLTLSFDGSNYIIDLKNSIDESVLTHNPELKTTKGNRNEHGYGVKIIQDIARKYNGLCDFYEEGIMFCCKVILCKST